MRTIRWFCIKEIHLTLNLLSHSPIHLLSTGFTVFTHKTRRFFYKHLNNDSALQLFGTASEIAFVLVKIPLMRLKACLSSHTVVNRQLERRKFLKK